MATEAVLGLDVGTTTVKAVLVDKRGGVLATGRSDQIPTHRPEPGAAEQDLTGIWDAIATAVARAMAATDTDPTVSALAMAAQSGSVCPIGLDGSPSARVITWLDSRSTELVRSWNHSVREQIRSVSGWHPGPGQGLATIAWLGQDQPDVMASTVRFASVDDAVGHLLTGQWATNPSNASGMQLMDVSTCTWDERLVELAGLGSRRLSPIVATGSHLGNLTTSAAQHLGLSTGIPVFAGGHDQTCAAMALGVLKPGVFMLSAGTAWVLTTVTDSADVERLPAKMNLGPHAVAGRWLASTNLGGLGVGLTDDADTLPAAVESVRQVVRSVGGVLGDPELIMIVGGGTGDERLAPLLSDSTGLPVEVFDDPSWPGTGAAGIAADAIGWPQPTTPTQDEECI